MALLLCFARQHALLLLVLVLLVLKNADAQPFRSGPFHRDFHNLWGSRAQHQRGGGNGGEVSGFKSRRSFRSGYFGASVKLQRGYTAGVITAFYVPHARSICFLLLLFCCPTARLTLVSTTRWTWSFLGRPYTLQTNVYVRGTGDGGPGRVVGREVKFHLDWFDPTADYHHYAILWTPSHIVFYVDDVPIRRYPRRGPAATFPQRPMWVYGSIWDASSWATDDGRYKADYRYSPFVARFSGLRLRACAARALPRCHPLAAGPSGNNVLSPQQEAAMRWVQRNHMVYNYCFDPKRNHALTPELVY